MTVVVVLLVLAALALLWWRRGRAQGQTPPSDGAAMPAQAPVREIVVPARWAMPPELAGFRRTEFFELEPVRQDAIRARLRDIPRPPATVSRLLSDAFVEQASADALAAEILTEPHVAAQVLATVNSALYGLPQPVASVRDAITYLGIDTVRAVCLRCLIAPTLAPSDARLRGLYDTSARASAIAAQLCETLGRRVGVEDTGAMVTAAVMSFLGHMVALGQRPVEDLLADQHADFLARTGHEQAQIGLSAGELGCVLLEEWQMPALIVEDVRQIDRIVHTPPKDVSPQKATRYALTYYGVRVAEKLASGAWADLASAVPEQLLGPEFFHVQTHFMVDARLKRLAIELRDPELVARIGRMLPPA